MITNKNEIILSNIYNCVSKVFQYAKQVEYTVR